MVGLHLAQHAAALLPGIDIPIVDAVGHKAVLASRNAAHIVARMGVSHVSFVAAQPDHTAAGACHAADIRTASEGLLAGQSGNGNVVQLQLLFGHTGIDLRPVDAVVDNPPVFSHNAAQDLFSPDIALGRTVFDLSGHGIGSGDAAQPVRTHQGTGKADGINGAAVDPHQPACLGGAALGQNSGNDLQILNHGSLLNIAEQAPGRARGADAHACDPVTAAVKEPAEGGDFQVRIPGQRNILFHRHLEIPAGVVQPAELCQPLHILRGGQRDFFVPEFILRFLRQGGKHQRSQQDKCHQDTIAFPFHASLPPSAAGSSPTISRFPAETEALICPVTSPLISASTMPLM